VALLAGTLTPGGAEKQLVYMARALHQSHAAVKVYSLSRGDFYEAALQRLELTPMWIGRHESPLLRLVAFARALRRFKPHVIQSGHFFCNLYVALAAPLVGAVSIGSIRSDARYELQEMGGWARWLLRLPRSIIANSQAAFDDLRSLGIPDGTCHVVPNVIDVAAFDANRDELDATIPRRESPVVVTVALRLDPVKRVDRFLNVLSLARRSLPTLRGIIVGDGPDRSRLETVARDLGLLPDGVQFLGLRHDVPAILRHADVFVLTSEHEGFPNVLLEAMTARLPIVTTPAGDARRVVTDGVTGYVVPFADVGAMAQRVLELMQSPPLRRRLGEAGRLRAEQSFNYAGLADRLLATYRTIAEQQRHGLALQACLACAAPALMTLRRSHH
jgi:glycosyltransferase involved in cell wall biosynthesis